MKTKIFRLLTLFVVSAFYSLSTYAVTILDTNFSDWKSVITTDQGNGTYQVPEASIAINGCRFNNSGAPNAGVNDTYPNYFRFGSNNHTLDITPSKPFVNGGKITVVISNNSSPAATVTSELYADDVLIASFDQLGKTHEVREVTLPETLNGVKKITIKRTGVSIFLFAVKIETNEAGPILKSFTVDETDATIDQANGTVLAELPYGTNLASITPIIELDGSAKSYSPTGAQDFSGGAVTYTLYNAVNSAESTESKTYSVTLTARESKRTDASLSDLMLDGTTVVGFAPDLLSYDFEIPYAADLPTIDAATTDDAASAVITQVEGVPGTATVVVTAEDGVTSATYSVHFTRKAAATGSLITSFQIVGQKGATVIDDEEGTIWVNMLIGTDVTALTPTIAVSSFATITPTGAQDFTNPILFTVIAEDGVTNKSYTVTVNLIEQAVLNTFPYSSDIPADYEIPTWMEGSTNGLVFNGAYAGSDMVALGSGADVLRLNANEKLVMHLASCATISIDLSATGGRTFKLYVDEVEVKSSESVSSNTKYVMTHDVNRSLPVVVAVQNVGSGGATVGRIEISDPKSTLVSDVRIATVWFDGTYLHNHDNRTLHIYNTLGVRVQTITHTTDLTALQNGIYIVKGAADGGEMKIVKR